tara:strand:- start:32 stop:532 length:501 start_codon:yes stop_codon:yes gene_type:complete
MRTIEQVIADMEAYKGKKTTKQYRTLKKELSSLEATETSDMGLGDVVESITKVTGIKAVVDKVSEVLDIDCGCEERKADWNQINTKTIRDLFRRKSVVNELSIEDYTTLCDLFEGGMPTSVSAEDQKRFHVVYKNAFRVSKPTTSCAPCVRETVKELYKLYELNSI